jgi:hypothetical protein
MRLITIPAFTPKDRWVRWALCAIASAAAIAPAAVLTAQSSPFAGAWNMTGTGPDSSYVYWLEIKEENGQFTGRFLNRVGNPVNLGLVKIENGELIFQSGRPDRLTGPEFRARLEGTRLVGHHTVRSGGRGETPATERVVNWVGVRRPAFPASDANAAHKYGTPVVLFDGKTMDAFGVQHPNRPLNWAVTDGLLANTPPSNNLVSKEKFGDFKVEIEYKLQQGSNSGLYLRGRYELQLLDDFGKPPAILGHASIYGRVVPLVNASKPVGEWQQLTAVLVGNRVTVTLNGQKMHDNVAIDGITGGALDVDELSPGPILIQGDHSLITIRRLTVTPIVK